MSEPVTSAAAGSGSGRPGGTREFFAELFGWTLAPGAAASSDEATASRAAAPMGEIRSLGGEVPDHTLISVVVTDVAATIERARRLGAELVMGRTESPAGLVFARMRDPAGRPFGIFTPPPVD